MICETRNKALISNDWFYSAPFCLFSRVACSYRSVKWRACLQLAMRSVKALFVDDFIQRSFDLLFSMPSSFLYVNPFYVQCFKNILIIYRTCLFIVHSVLYTFSSPYGLFKSRGKRKKKVALHNGIYIYIFLVTFVLWLLFHGIFGYSCSM